MHVVVVYDADPAAGQDLRRLLVTRLHRIQNSVWAGELSRLEWDDLRRELEATAGAARLQAWVFRSPPEIHRFGSQGDAQSMFV